MKKLKPEFVEFIPDNIAEGVLYVSMQYGTAVHSCACGCGNEVVTPFGTSDWDIKYDGETVTLNPSIGNWSFECQSHYWIDKNKVTWAQKWSYVEIDANRKEDFEKRKTSYGESRSNPIRWVLKLIGL